MAATSIAKRKRKTVDGEALYRKCRRSAPVMLEADVDEMEQYLKDPTRHMWRRAAFGVLMMSGEELFSKIEADRKSALVFAEMAIGIRDYIKDMRGLLDLLDSAHARIELGLCAREDCKAVRAEADKEYAAEPEVAHA